MNGEFGENGFSSRQMSRKEARESKAALLIASEISFISERPLAYSTWPWRPELIMVSAGQSEMSRKSDV